MDTLFRIVTRISLMFLAGMVLYASWPLALVGMFVTWQEIKVFFDVVGWWWAVGGEFAVICVTLFICHARDERAREEAVRRYAS